MKPKALYVLDEGAYELIYGPDERSDIAELAEVYAPPQTAESIAQDASVLEEAEVILSGWEAPVMDEAFLASAPNLRAVLYGAGTIRYFATDALWGRDVRVTSAYAANAVPVSEYTLASVLFSLKRIPAHAAQVRESGSWPHQIQAPGAYGSTVGLLSLGMVGKLVAEHLRPFDVTVIAHDPYALPEDAAELGVRLVSLDEVFSGSDVVSVHTPWLPETEGMVTGAQVRAMKQGSTLINTSRGAVIRETELVQVLGERPDLWAILDVTYPEPPEPESPLYTLPNVMVTPHIAGSQGTECRRMGRLVVEELKNYVAGAQVGGQRS